MMLLLMVTSITILNTFCQSNLFEKVSKVVESEISETAIQQITLNNKLRRSVINENQEELQPNEYCRQFKTCAECTQTSLYTCDWCHNYGCTNIAFQLCPRAIKRINTLRATDLCPKIDYNSTILISYGIKANIKMKLRAPDPALYDKEFICQVKFGKRLSHLKALIIGKVVYCYPIIFDDKSEPTINNGSLQIIWGGMEPFSNIVPITAYQCEKMAGNCDSCLEIPHEYGCGWCSTIQRCVIGDKCSEDVVRWTINRVKCSEKKLQYI